jgi:hypothetical protein
MDSFSKSVRPNWRLAHLTENIIFTTAPVKLCFFIADCKESGQEDELHDCKIQRNVLNVLFEVYCSVFGGWHFNC